MWYLFICYRIELSISLGPTIILTSDSINAVNTQCYILKEKQKLTLTVFVLSESSAQEISIKVEPSNMDRLHMMI